MEMSGDVPEDILNDSNLLPPHSKPDLPDDLQAKLDAYNENFDRISNVLGDESLLDASAATEVRIEKTRELIVCALPVAVQTVMELANYSLSDSIRLKAACYIIDRVMGKEIVGEEDKVGKLFQRLQPKEGG